MTHCYKFIINQSIALIILVMTQYAYGNSLGNLNTKYSNGTNVAAPTNPQLSLTGKSVNKINWFFKSLGNQERRYKRLHTVYSKTGQSNQVNEFLYYSSNSKIPEAKKIDADPILAALKTSSEAIISSSLQSMSLFKNLFSGVSLSFDPLSADKPTITQRPIKYSLFGDQMEGQAFQSFGMGKTSRSLSTHAVSSLKIPEQ